MLLETFAIRFATESASVRNKTTMRTMVNLSKKTTTLTFIIMKDITNPCRLRSTSCTLKLIFLIFIENVLK